MNIDKVQLAPRSEISRQLNCLLVSELDPLTGQMRTGAALRYNNPPSNVSYTLYKQKLEYPKYIGHYGLGWVSVPLSSARLFSEALFPIKRENYSLIHSMFWSIHRYPIPWIHENDQSLGQYFSDYISFEGFWSKKIVRIATNMLNSERCKAIILWSDWAKKGYIRDGVDPSKIRIIPPAFETSRYEIQHKSKNILFIGRDYYRKGGDVALKVFERLRKSFDDLRLTFIGKIQDRNTLEKVRRDSSISYYNHVSKQDLHEKILPSSDIFLLPTAAEAYGMSIIESMCKGVPVVASRVSAIPEVVEDGVSGFLVTPGSTDEFAEKCERLLGDEVLRKKMGNNARTKIEKAFSPEKIGHELYNLYLDCVG